MKRYEVIRDLQGGSFGMDRQFTAEEWLEQALEWLDADGWDIDDSGIAYWKNVIAEGREEELIAYIEETWELEMREVNEETNEQITTTCYGHTDKWGSREQAVRHFQECAMGSEGAERERYTNIILQLLEGQTDCHDKNGE